MPTSSLFAVFIFSFAIGFGAVVSPGPVSIAIVTQSPKHGWIVGPLVATGHSILEFIIVILIAFGLSSEMTSPTIQIAIAILGGLFLFWMGINMIAGIYKGSVHLPGANEDSSDMSYFQFVSLGIVATISNPFWYAWWMTVAVVYLSQAQELGVASVAAFYLGHISADFVWDTTLSAIIGSGRKWITDKLYSGIIAICGSFFLYLGVVFLLRAFSLINQ